VLITITVSFTSLFLDTNNWYDELGTSSQLVVPGAHTAGLKLRCQTPTTHMKNITSNFSQARSTRLDGSEMIRNMSE